MYRAKMAISGLDEFIVTEVRMNSEVLYKKPTPLFKQLWVRISIALLLICLICFANYWWPRRTILAAWRANASVACASMHDLTSRFLTWWDPNGTGISKQFTYYWELFSWMGVDEDVTWVDLRESQVDDRWLENLKRFPQLFLLGINDCQLGPGLEFVKDTRSLESLIVKSPRERRLMELRRIPQIQILSLRDVASVDVGLEVLTSLAKLNEISFVFCQKNDRFLKDLPEHPNLETFRIHWCPAFKEDDLANLRRLPNLKTLIIEASTPVNDAGLAHICELKNLETLILRRSVGEITDGGFQSLRKLARLKEFFVSKGDLTNEQLTSLKELLPNVTISD